MTHKITLSVETIDDERRDAMLKALSSAFEQTLRGADEVKIKFEHKREIMRGKAWQGREIKLGGDTNFTFELIELGILSTQRGMDFDDEPAGDESQQSDVLEEYDPLITPPPFVPRQLTAGDVVEGEYTVESEQLDEHEQQLADEVAAFDQEQRELEEVAA